MKNKQYSILFYKKDGTPYENSEDNRAVIAWAKDFENIEYRTVGHTVVGYIRVSTVWLGLDHGIGDKPMIFETMIFGDDTFSDYQKRYSSEKQAKKGHDKAIELVTYYQTYYRTIYDIEERKKNA